MISISFSAVHAQQCFTPKGLEDYLHEKLDPVVSSESFDIAATQLLANTLSIRYSIPVSHFSEHSYSDLVTVYLKHELPSGTPIISADEMLNLLFSSYISTEGIVELTTPGQVRDKMNYLINLFEIGPILSPAQIVAITNRFAESIGVPRQFDLESIINLDLEMKGFNDFQAFVNKNPERRKVFIGTDGNLLSALYDMQYGGNVETYYISRRTLTSDEEILKILEATKHITDSNLRTLEVERLLKDAATRPLLYSELSDAVVEATNMVRPASFDGRMKVQMEKVMSGDARAKAILELSRFVNTNIDLIRSKEPIEIVDAAGTKHTQAMLLKFGMQFIAENWDFLSTGEKELLGEKSLYENLDINIKVGVLEGATIEGEADYIQTLDSESGAAFNDMLEESKPMEVNEEKLIDFLNGRSDEVFKAQPDLGAMASDFFHTLVLMNEVNKGNRLQMTPEESRIISDSQINIRKTGVGEYILSAQSGQNFKLNSDGTVSALAPDGSAIANVNDEMLSQIGLLETVNLLREVNMGVTAEIAAEPKPIAGPVEVKPGNEVMAEKKGISPEASAELDDFSDTSANNMLEPLIAGLTTDLQDGCLEGPCSTCQKVWEIIAHLEAYYASQNKKMPDALRIALDFKQAVDRTLDENLGDPTNVELEQAMIAQEKLNNFLSETPQMSTAERLVVELVRSQISLALLSGPLPAAVKHQLSRARIITLERAKQIAESANEPGLVKNIEASLNNIGAARDQNADLVAEVIIPSDSVSVEHPATQDLAEAVSQAISVTSDEMDLIESVSSSETTGEPRPVEQYTVPLLSGSELQITAESELGRGNFGVVQLVTVESESGLEQLVMKKAFEGKEHYLVNEFLVGNSANALEELVDSDARVRFVEVRDAEIDYKNYDPKGLPAFTESNIAKFKGTEQYSREREALLQYDILRKHYSDKNIVEVDAISRIIKEQYKGTAVHKLLAGKLRRKLQFGVKAMFMELVDGSSLKAIDVVPNGIFAAMIEFQKKYHDAGFVHKDLHSGNIMITPDGKVVFIDLGFMLDLRGIPNELREPVFAYERRQLKATIVSSATKTESFTASVARGGSDFERNYQSVYDSIISEVRGSLAELEDSGLHSSPNRRVDLLVGTNYLSMRYSSGLLNLLKKRDKVFGTKSSDNRIVFDLHGIFTRTILRKKEGKLNPTVAEAFMSELGAIRQRASTTDIDTAINAMVDLQIALMHADILTLKAPLETVSQAESEVESEEIASSILKEGINTMWGPVVGGIGRAVLAVYNFFAGPKVEVKAVSEGIEGAVEPGAAESREEPADVAAEVERQLEEGLLAAEGTEVSPRPVLQPEAAEPVAKAKPLFGQGTLGRVARKAAPLAAVAAVLMGADPAYAGEGGPTVVEMVPFIPLLVLPFVAMIGMIIATFAPTYDYSADVEETAASEPSSEPPSATPRKVTVYHGTNPEAAKSIVESGLKSGAVDIPPHRILIDQLVDRFASPGYERRTARYAVTSTDSPGIMDSGAIVSFEVDPKTARVFNLDIMNFMLQNAERRSDTFSEWDVEAQEGFLDYAYEYWDTSMTLEEFLALPEEERWDNHEIIIPSDVELLASDLNIEIRSEADIPGDVAAEVGRELEEGPTIEDVRVGTTCKGNVCKVIPRSERPVFEQVTKADVQSALDAAFVEMDVTVEVTFCSRKQCKVRYNGIGDQQNIEKIIEDVIIGVLDLEHERVNALKESYSDQIQALEDEADEAIGRNADSAEMLANLEELTSEVELLKIPTDDLVRLKASLAGIANKILAHYKPNVAANIENENYGAAINSEPSLEDIVDDAEIAAIISQVDQLTESEPVRAIDLLVRNEHKLSGNTFEDLLNRALLSKINNNPKLPGLIDWDVARAAGRYLVPNSNLFVEANNYREHIDKHLEWPSLFNIDQPTKAVFKDTIPPSVILSFAFEAGLSVRRAPGEAFEANMRDFGYGYDITVRLVFAQDGALVTFYPVRGDAEYFENVQMQSVQVPDWATERQLEKLRNADIDFIIMDASTSLRWRSDLGRDFGEGHTNYVISSAEEASV